MKRKVIGAVVATGLGLVALAGCGDRDAATVATPPAPAEPTVLEPPPPTLAAQHEMALNELGAEVTEKGFVVTLGSADFPSGKADFNPASTDRLDRVAALMKERPELQLQILGFTDDRGSAKANERLSQQRADAVKQAFTSRAGVNESRITAKGMGEADPVAKNDTEEGRNENRRVELRLVDDTGGFTTQVELRPTPAPSVEP